LEKVKNVFTTAGTLSNMLLRLNMDANFDEWPSIEGYLAAKSKGLREMGYEPDSSNRRKPHYVELKLASGCFARKQTKEGELKKIRDALFSFVLEFRMVEQELLKVFVN